MSELADTRLGEAMAALSGPTDQGPKEPRGCRWITGDVRSGHWRYCQAKAAGSYCPEHAARAVVGGGAR